jgi:hypothetical protein
MAMVVVWQLGSLSERSKVVEGVERSTCCVTASLCKKQGGKTCPLNGTTCGLPAALSLTVSVPL